jgi:urea transport system substrate-binding protein
LDQRVRARACCRFEELNGLLFYPVQYEGEESSYNVFYTGAAPNQQAIPAVEYLMSKEGRRRQEVGAARHRLRVPAHHEQDSCATSCKKGRRRVDIMEQYTPFGHSDYQTIVADVKKFAQARRPPWSLRSTATRTCRSTRSSPTRGLKAKDIPVGRVLGR